MDLGNISALVEKVMSKLSGNPTMMSDFSKNAQSVVQKIVGDSVPKDIIDKVVTAVKTKLLSDQNTNLVDGIKNLLG